MSKLRSEWATCWRVARWVGVGMLVATQAHALPDTFGSIALGTVLGGGVSGPAAEAPRLTPEALGGVLGGAATRVDLCVQSGLLPDDGKRAERQFDALLRHAESVTGETLVFAQMRGGWERMRQVLTAADHASLSPLDCAAAARQWRQAKTTYPIQ